MSATVGALWATSAEQVQTGLQEHVSRRDDEALAGKNGRVVITSNKRY